MELVGNKQWKPGKFENLEQFTPARPIPSKMADLDRDLSWEPALSRLLLREIPKAGEVLLLAFITVTALFIAFI